MDGSQGPQQVWGQAGPPSFLVQLTCDPWRGHLANGVEGELEQPVVCVARAVGGKGGAGGQMG
jgi:hypothetical protein